MLASKPVLHDAYLEAGVNGSAFGEKVDSGSSATEKDGWGGIMVRFYLVRLHHLVSVIT